MSTKKVEISSEVKSLVEVFKKHPHEKLTFAKACELANVEVKTGYLSSVKKQLYGNLIVGEKDTEVQVLVKKKVNSYTYDPIETN